MEKEKHNNVNVFEIRENNNQKDLTPNLINSVYCLLDCFKLKIQRSDTLGRCLLNALEFVDFQSYILIILISRRVILANRNVIRDIRHDMSET